MIISRARLAQLDLIVILVLFSIIPSINVSLRSFIFTFKNLLAYPINLLRGKIKLYAILLVSLLALFGLFFINYMDRFSKGGSDRFDLWFRAVDTILSNQSLLFCGSGQLHSFAHNTFFSLLLGLSIIPSILLVLVACIGYLITIPKVDNNIDFTPSLSSSLSFLYLLFSNSMFNSGFTQPLLSCSLVLAFYFSFALSPNYNLKR